MYQHSAGYSIDLEVKIFSIAILDLGHHFLISSENHVDTCVLTVKIFLIFPSSVGLPQPTVSLLSTYRILACTLQMSMQSYLLLAYKLLKS